jgi:thiol-disulfide isomerase/thioredoxin
MRTFLHTRTLSGPQKGTEKQHTEITGNGVKVKKSLKLRAEYHWSLYTEISLCILLYPCFIHLLVRSIMKKFHFLLFLLLCCFTVRLSAQTVISGTLLGGDGKPMAKAHVHITASKFTPASKTVEVDKNGAYRISIDNPQPFFFVQYTGASHKIETLPLLVEKNKHVSIDVRLSPNARPAVINGVTLIGDFNEFDFGSGIMMKKQADGTFAADVKTDKKSLAYQLIVDEGNPMTLRSVNGTSHNTLVYDGGGDYRSVVDVTGGKAHIVFDPNKMYPTQKNAVVEFAPDSRQYETFTRLAQEAEARSSHIRTMFMTAQTDDNKRAVVTMLQQAIDSLSQRIAREKNPDTRRALSLFTLDLLQMTTLDKEKMQPVLKQAFTDIAPDSPLWSYNPYLLSSASYLADSVAAYQYMQTALDRHPDPKVRLAMINSLMSEAFYSGRKEQGEKYYTMLVKEFPESQEADNARKSFDPNRAIQSGKQVPDFSFASLNGDGTTISRAGMKGRYYLIDFWATWCGPCVGEMANLHNAYEKYKGKNFEIISLSFDGKPEDVEKFRGKKWKMPWKHAFIKGGFESDAARAFEVAGIPKPVLVDPDGNIVATEVELRGEQLAHTLEKYLGAR